MHHSNLRAVGGSIMMAIPKAILEMLGLEANDKVGLSVKNGQLIVAPSVKPKYTLEELMAQCDLKKRLSKKSRGLLDAPPVGREEI
jgi:antitoxin ChpS